MSRMVAEGYLPVSLLDFIQFRRGQDNCGRDHHSGLLHLVGEEGARPQLRGPGYKPRDDVGAVPTNPRGTRSVCSVRLDSVENRQTRLSHWSAVLMRQRFSELQLAADLRVPREPVLLVPGCERCARA
jgi:hypothetical protein